MTIRTRTDSRSSRISGLVAVLGLGGAAAVHGVWASGSTWPASDRVALADLVVGTQPLPSARATWLVAGLLAGATAVTALHSGVATVSNPALERPVRISARLVTGVLVARGAAGLVSTSLVVGGRASEAFVRWNRRLYSPLCLGLGAAVAWGGMGRQS